MLQVNTKMPDCQDGSAPACFKAGRDSILFGQAPHGSISC